MSKATAEVVKVYAHSKKVCIIRKITREDGKSYLCGYVVIGKESPLYGKDMYKTSVYKTMYDVTYADKMPELMGQYVVGTDFAGHGGTCIAAMESALERIVKQIKSREYYYEIKELNKDRA